MSILVYDEIWVREPRLMVPGNCYPPSYPVKPEFGAFNSSTSVWLPPKLTRVLANGGGDAQLTYTGTGVTPTSKWYQNYSTSGSSYFANAFLVTTGDLTICFVVARDIDTAASGRNSVHSVFHGPAADQIEINMGNIYGGAGDKNKPRATGLTGGAYEAWMDGRKQASVNPFTDEAITGRFHSIVIRYKGNSKAEHGVLITGYDFTTTLALYGRLAFFSYTKCALPDGMCQEISATPWVSAFVPA